jgi:hypothetical protein
MQKPQSLRERSADMACARAPNIEAIETRFGAPRIANFALATDSALWRSMGRTRIVLDSTACSQRD